MSTLTHDELLDIVQQSLFASTADDPEKAVRIMQQKPLAPHLAKAAKEIWGKDYLNQSGFDLSDAEQLYGKDWLNQ